ncbi:unnamed protein product [Symbiodinium necroappetens]|uniref:Uncharacterized protein n=1 Tax=Symbiodinium necroappetens TaxID=1628268 RepID=A0A813CII1_9DINO|nr:unnamed protein product [Symbiodinium necroappetens]
MSQADRERSYSSQHRYRAAQKLRSSSVTRSRVDRGSASTPRRARAESRGSDLFNASVGGNSQQDHFLRTAKKSESMLCHSLGGSFCERPPKMPQTDRTTTTVPTAAWNQRNLRSRCDVWGAACSPRRLETVRQELAAVRADVRCLRGFLDATTIATSQLARQSVESRQHLRKLMEEERIEGAECDSALLKGPDEEERERLESLAEEVSELGSQVSDLAQQQLECYKDVQYLRGFTALVRLRQRANAATLQSRNFGQQCDSKAKELDKTKEQMAALRLKAHSLREEAAKAKVEAADVGEDSALQFLEALRVELGAEESLLVDCTCTLPPSCQALQAYQAGAWDSGQSGQRGSASSLASQAMSIGLRGAVPRRSNSGEGFEPLTDREWPKALLVRRAPRSASDRLLYDSLRREVGRMKSRRRKKDEVSQVRWIRPALQGGPRRRSLASFSGAPVAARVLGAVCFLGPLALAIPYGAQFFASSSTLRELLLKPLLPLVLAYHSSRFANLLCIAALYGLVVPWLSLHPLTCSLGRQASTLMMMQFPANFLLQFLGATPGPLANLARAVIFLYFVYSVSLGVLGSLRGRAFELPFVGTGAGTFSLRSPRPSSQPAQ